MSNKPTIAEMNKAIAEFTGWEFREVEPDWFHAFHNSILMWADNGKFVNKVMIEGFRYHEDWAKLMPVIETISKLPLLNADGTPCTDPQDVCHPITFAMPTEDGKQVMFRFKGFSLHTADTLIEAAHAAVYEVAEYHNSQNNNQ